MYPLLLSIGPVGVQTAGVVGIIAAWLAVRAAEKEMAAKGHAPEAVRDFLGPALLAGFIAARLAYVLLLDPALPGLHALDRAPAGPPREPEPAGG